MIEKLIFAGVKSQEWLKKTFWFDLFFSKGSIMGFFPLLIFPLKNSVFFEIIFSSNLKLILNRSIIQGTVNLWAESKSDSTVSRIWNRRLGSLSIKEREISPNIWKFVKWTSKSLLFNIQEIPE